MTITNDISQWYAYEYTNECLVYIINMNSDDFNHGILTVIAIIFIRVFFFEYIVA